MHRRHQRQGRRRQEQHRGEPGDQARLGRQGRRAARRRPGPGQRRRAVQHRSAVQPVARHRPQEGTARGDGRRPPADSA